MLSNEGPKFRGWRALLLCLLLAGGCRRATPVQENKPVAEPKPAQGISPEQAAQVLARVGDKSITLGEYAAALERMAPFERMRYQSLERRKQLLDEMINLELLAQEAKRQGLDRDPLVQMRIDQALRDEMLRQRFESLPGPEAIAEHEVRAYYDAHQQEFNEPERRRLSEIVVADPRLAEQVLNSARAATAAEWGALVRAHSTAHRSSAEPLPLELEGDLGVVSAPGRTGGNEPTLAPELLQAAFAIEKVGGVSEKPVLVQGKYHVLRLTSLMPARQRTYAEAERSVRMTLAQKHIETSRQELLDELKKQLPVSVNAALIAKVKSTNQP